MSIFREFFKTQSDQNIHQNAQNCTKSLKFLGELSVMEYISRVKWNCCAKFRQALLSTEGMVIAEATSCDYWIGLVTCANCPSGSKKLF